MYKRAFLNINIENGISHACNHILCRNESGQEKKEDESGKKIIEVGRKK